MFVGIREKVIGPDVNEERLSRQTQQIHFIQKEHPSRKALKEDSAYNCNWHTGQVRKQEFLSISLIPNRDTIAVLPIITPNEECYSPVPNCSGLWSKSWTTCSTGKHTGQKKQPLRTSVCEVRCPSNACCWFSGCQKPTQPLSQILDSGYTATFNIPRQFAEQAEDTLP